MARRRQRKQSRRSRHPAAATKRKGATEQKEKVSDPANKKSNASKATSIWENVSTVADPSPHHRLESMETPGESLNIDWSLPAIIALPAEHPCLQEPKEKDKEDADSLVVMAFKKFHKKFMADDTRNDPGRAARNMKADVGQVVTTSLLALVGDDAKCNPSDDLPIETGVRALLAPSLFAVAKDRETVSGETAWRSSMRVTYSGTRSVVCVPFAAAVEFLRPKAALVTPKIVFDWLKTAQPAALQEFKSSSPAAQVYHSTVGPRDCFYLPAAWVFYERASAANDTLGCRIQFFGKLHLDLMEKTSRALTVAQKPSADLNSACDILNLLG